MYRGVLAKCIYRMDKIWRDAYQVSGYNLFFLSIYIHYPPTVQDIVEFLKVVGMVNSSPNFEEQAKVIDRASDLFVKLFGEAGRHSR